MRQEPITVDLDDALDADSAKPIQPESQDDVDPKARTGTSEPEPTSLSQGRRYRRRGRPPKARGQPNSSDAASARWTVRGVPPPVRDIALRAAENRNMTVGDWVAEAIVAYARGRTAPEPEAPKSNVPATESPPDLVSMIHRLDDRLTRIEGWQDRGIFGRLFGRP